MVEVLIQGDLIPSYLTAMLNYGITQLRLRLCADMGLNGIERTLIQASFG